MGYWEHECAGCKQLHDAPFWYYRDVRKSREYLCGEQFNKLAQKADWRPLEPDTIDPRGPKGGGR